MANPAGTLESCANFTRGGVAAVPDHDALERQRSERIKSEQKRLVQWAEENRKLKGRIPKDDTGGGEHTVRLHSHRGRVVKSTLPNRHRGYGIALGSYSQGATPAEYLDRLALQNEIFNDDIRLERVVVRNGNPIIVTSQPAIKGDLPTQDALDEMMLQKGFEHLAAGAYYDSGRGLLVFDLFPKNARQAKDGVIYPFDPVVQRITPDFADFLRQNPKTINR